MKYLVSFIKWYIDGAWRFLGFLFTVTAAVAFLQVLIVFPVQVMATIIIGFVIYASFLFFSEL